MKKTIFLFVIIFAAGCQTEKDVKPVEATTFIRYMGSENNHKAILAEEADNGYSLLSTVEVPTDNLGGLKYKIKFMHTDLNGGMLWEKSYPAFGEEGSYKASSFIHLENKGYLIIGDKIHDKDSSDLFLLQIDYEGNIQNSRTITLPQVNLHGRGVAVDDALSNYILLGQIEGDTGNDMFVSKVRSDDWNATPEWSREYGAGKGTLVNKIYTDSDKRLLWAGSVTFNSPSDIRVVMTPENSQNTNLGNLFGAPEVAELAQDLCKVSGGYAVVGSTNVNGDEDIYVTKISNNAVPLFTKQFDFAGQNDNGVSICPTPDGGYAILGDVESGDKGNGQKDYYVLKVDAFGNEQWSANFGGADKEEGASIRSTSDGSYLIFGTTYYGRLKKLMLMKVNKEGKF